MRHVSKRRRFFKDPRGFSLVEILIAGLVGAILIFAYGAGISHQVSTTNAITQKMLAQNYAEETGELFRSMTPAELKGYLTTIGTAPAPCPPLPGDYNGDGKVTRSGDWVIWKRLPLEDRNQDGQFTDDDKDYEIFDDLFPIKQSQCGRVYCPEIPGDYDRDGDVDSSDAAVPSADTALVASNMGRVSSCGRPGGVAPNIPGNQVPYRLGEDINPKVTPALPAHLIYPDYIADLPPDTGLRNAHRKYKVQIADLDTLEPKYVGDLITARTLASDEAYVVTTEITYGENGKVILSHVIPNISPPPSGPLICSANYTVPGRANPYLAGVANGTSIYYANISTGSGIPTGNHCDRAYDPSRPILVPDDARCNNSATAKSVNQAPTLVVPTNAGCITGGAVLTFNVSGTTAYFQSIVGPVDADGVTSRGNDFMSHHILNGWDSFFRADRPSTCANLATSPGYPNGGILGKSDMCAPLNSMGGVFLDDSDPSTLPTPPPYLNYSVSANRNLPAYAPQLRQLFYIGNGTTNGGLRQRFTVPAGATRLFVYGGMGYQWNDSTGSLNIQMVWERP